MRQISTTFGKKFAAFRVKRQIFCCFSGRVADICRFGQVCRIQGTFRANLWGRDHAALAKYAAFGARSGQISGVANMPLLSVWVAPNVPLLSLYQPMTHVCLMTFVNSS